jgi:hypothetical protein
LGDAISEGRIADRPNKRNSPQRCQSSFPKPGGGQPVVTVNVLVERLWVTFPAASVAVGELMAIISSYWCN